MTDQDLSHFLVAAFFLSFLLLFRRGWRRHVLWAAPVSIVAAVFFFGRAQETEASARGFASVTAMREADLEAREKAASDRAREQSTRELQAMTARAEQQVREARRLHTESLRIADAAENCRRDAVCFANTHLPAAANACIPRIEAAAIRDYRWTASFTRFSAHRWRDEVRGVVTYEGDEIEMQNGFGAWMRHSYFCDFDTNTGLVEQVYVRAGRA